MKIIDWNKISDSRKAKINSKKTIFLLGPRDMSVRRIKEINMFAGSRGQLIWGCLKDEYISGFEGSPHFKALELKKLKETLENKDIQILSYFSRDLQYILDELNFAAVILINGSWHKTLHTNAFFWQIINKNIKYKLLSPFSSDGEAEEYEINMREILDSQTSYNGDKEYDEIEIMRLVERIAKRSYATDWQTSAVLAKKNGKKYKILATSHNVVVPYETAALHHGSIKEKYFSPPNDLNHFDTNHAEVELLISVNKSNIELKDSSLFINLMPCPTCSRMLARTEIAEIVYSHDHSGGYAFDLLTKVGKKIRRIIS